jgi:antitoxin component of MazEF toxin-antitoxin module
MGFPTKIQVIKRAKSEQWYINLPAAIAQAMEFERGEVVEWLIENKQKMILKRDESRWQQYKEQQLLVSVDASYTNEQVLKHLPEGSDVSSAPAPSGFPAFSSVKSCGCHQDVL